MVGTADLADFIPLPWLNMCGLSATLLTGRTPVSSQTALTKILQDAILIRSIIHTLNRDTENFQPVYDNLVDVMC